MNTSDLRDLVQGAALIFVGHLIGQVLGLVGEISIIRSLPPQEYGHIALAYTVVLVVSQLSRVGIADGVTRMMSAAEDESERWDVFRSGIIISSIVVLISFIVIYSTREQIATILGDRYLFKYLLYLTPYIILHPLAMVAFSAVRSNKRSIDAVFARYVIPRTISLGFLLVVIHFLRLPIFGAIIYWILIQGLIFILSIYSSYLSTDEDILGIPERETIFELIRFSWPLAAGSVLFMVLSRIDILMIGYFLDAKNVGLYRSIQPLKQAPIFAMTAFNFLFYPLATEYYSNSDIRSLGRIYTITTKWMSLIAFPISILIVLYPVSIIDLLLSSAYTPAAGALSVLIAGIFFRVIVGLNGSVVKSINRPKVELYSASIGIIFNIILNVYLIPRFGIIGAALATICGYIVYNIVEVAYIYSTTKIHPFSLNTMKPILVSGFFTVLLKSEISNIKSFNIIFILILVYVMLVGSLIVTRSFDEADMLLLEEIEDYTGVDLSTIKSLFDGY